MVPLKVSLGIKKWSTNGLSIIINVTNSVDFEMFCRSLDAKGGSRFTSNTWG